MNANEPISKRVIAAAFEVSNHLGCGFLEQVYARALAIELQQADISFERECPIAVYYKNTSVGSYIADFVVEDCLVLELKAVSQICPEHGAQLLNYLRAGRKSVGPILNFGQPRLGIKRMALDHDDTQSI